MTLPLLISVPHAGLTIPPEVLDLCILTPEQILADSDEGAAEIYNLHSQVAEYVTTDIARAIVDQNRADDDRRSDGVVKTHTIWNQLIYSETLPEALIHTLLKKYYNPYHQQLTELSRKTQIKLGLDCHTMVAFGPPVGPDPKKKRPWICLSNNDKTCPQPWLEKLAECFRKTFDNQVSINHPFRGGYIIHSHADELPWIQVEISRDPFYPNTEKRTRVLEAITTWCKTL